MKIEIKPTTEALHNDGGNWEVRQVGFGQKAATDSKKKKMRVPTGTDNFDEYQRMLQMGHAKSPRGEIIPEDLEYIGQGLIESCNDMRVKMFLKEKLINKRTGLREYECKIPEEVAMLNSISKKNKIPFNVCVETLIESEGTKTGASLKRSYKKNMSTSKYKLALSILNGASDIINTHSTYRLASDKTNYRYFDWMGVIQAGKYVREQLEKEEEDEENKNKQKQNKSKQEKDIEEALEKTKEKQKQDIREEVINRSTARQKSEKYLKKKTKINDQSYQPNELFLWEKMRVVKSRLTVKSKKNKIGKQERTSFEGRFANPARWAIDRKAFRRSRPLGNSGALLVDNSGSMDIRLEYLDELMKISPTVNIRSYLCMRISDDIIKGIKQGNHGKLIILAEKGMRVNKEELRKNNISGFNGCDMPALQWLAKQKGPKFWITDTLVAKIYNIDPTSSSLCDYREWAASTRHPEFIEECFVFCRKNTIHILPNMQRAIAVLKKIRKRSHV